MADILPGDRKAKPLKLGRAVRAVDRRLAANNEGSRSAQFGMGWASAANNESGSVARHYEREWGR